MAEQADAMVSNTIVRKDMRVRFPLRAPTFRRTGETAFSVSETGSLGLR
jgi:hypothetical protein